MKRALIIVTAIALAACGGAVDPESPTDPATAATATATEVIPTSTGAAAADDTATPAAGGEPHLTPVGEPVTPGWEGSEFPLDAAVQDLAQRLNINPSDIDVISVEKVIWSDSSLGCPQPGMMYAQVITEGYRILLEAIAQFYPYHTDTRGTLILCMDGGEQGHIIPYTPGDGTSAPPPVLAVTDEAEIEY